MAMATPIHTRTLTQAALFEKLCRAAQFEVRDRIKLNALCETLGHFHIPPTDWPICGEGILRFEKIAKSRPALQAGDEKMQMLFKMYAEFKRRSFA